MAKGPAILRSVELVAISFEKGLLNKYITKLNEAEKNLLESVLWGVKLNGCAVTKGEIEQIIGIETKWHQTTGNTK